MPDTAIDFGEDISIEAITGLVFGIIRDKQGNVGHGVREIDEKGFVLMAFDEINGVVCIGIG